MKIAYLLYPEAVVINKANGIRNQALTWKKQLEGRCEVDLISPWDEIDWIRYDAVHIFGGDQWLGFIPDLLKKIPNVIFSPILDSIVPIKKVKFQASLGFKGYHHAQNLYKMYLRNFKKIFVRSQYEAEYFLQAYDCPPEQIEIVPISYDITDEYLPCQKEKFCLHISAIYQERKNVLRLIEASKKYKFPLYLGGNWGNSIQKQHIIDTIDNTPWVKLIGYISDEDALNLYRRCKVFALPSINEGVGIVALNAAVQGANIVITNVGGPKEYYGNFAYQVDPHNVDAIGQAVLRAMDDDTMQPHLRQHVITNYCCEAIAERLVNAYNKLTK